MIFAVIDTNVLIAALLSKHDDAATVQIVEHIFTGDIIPVYSDDIISEYRNVLQRKKFKFPLETQEHLVSAIEKYGHLIYPIATWIKLPDEKDLPFYEAAAHSSSYYLVTGNKKHFPDEDFIITPREMIAIMDKHKENG